MRLRLRQFSAQVLGITRTTEILIVHTVCLQYIKGIVIGYKAAIFSNQCHT